MANSNNNVLHKIGADRKKAIESQKSVITLGELKKDSLKIHRPKNLFLNQFKGSSKLSNSYKVIAEVKKASPSLGDIAPHLNHLDVASQYIENGAAALSVLTEPDYFKGKIQYLIEIREKYPEIPLLMKDFFVDDYQFYQAKKIGADAVLIIIGLLSKEQAKSFLELATELNLTPLVEVHDKKELDIALEIGSPLIGINNRNLVDLTISLETTINLSQNVPKEIPFISESGINSNQDLKRLSTVGTKGFLVGSSLMKTGNPGVALKSLIGD